LFYPNDAFLVETLLKYKENLEATLEVRLQQTSEFEKVIKMKEN